MIIEESGHTANLADVLRCVGPAMTWGNPKISILIGTAGTKTSHYYSLLAEAAGGAEKLEALLEGIRQGTEKPFQISQQERARADRCDQQLALYSRVRRLSLIFLSGFKRS